MLDCAFSFKPQVLSSHSASSLLERHACLFKSLDKRLRVEWGECQNSAIISKTGFFLAFLPGLVFVRLRIGANLRTTGSTYPTAVSPTLSGQHQT